MINYPGEICLALYHFLKSSPELSLLIWRGMAMGSFVLLLLFPLFSLLPDKSKPNAIHRFFGSSVSFLLVAVIAVVCLRLPNLILPEQNVDESQWIANAATFGQGATLWKEVTGYTGGPLLYAPLNIMSFLTDGLNYTSIRLFGLLFCIIPSIVLVYKTLSRIGRQATAYFGTLILVLFYAMANGIDTIAYNSEHVPMVLTAGAIYLLVCVSSRPAAPKWKLLLLGFLLGLLPYAKLQAVPIGVAIGLIALVEIWRNNNNNRDKLFSLAGFSAMVLLPSILLAIYLVANDAVADFWKGYIQENLYYTKYGTGKVQGGLRQWLMPFAVSYHYTEWLYYFFLVSTLPLVALLIMFKDITWGAVLRNKLLLYMVIIFVAAYFSVVFPGSPFAHYVLLMVVPLTVLVGCIIQLVSVQPLYTQKNRILFVVMSILILFSLGRQSMRKVPKGIEFAAHKTYEIKDISAAIRQYAKPGEKLAIWGWIPPIYAETGLVQAHKAAHTSLYQLTIPELKDAFLEDYIQGLLKSKPAVFVDALTPDAYYYNDTTLRHDNFPSLAEIISKNYELIETVGGQRIYVLTKKIDK